MKRWQLQICVVILSSYVYVLMEWLHFFTKPSFLSALDLGPSVAVLLQAPLPLLVAGLSLSFPFLLISILVRRKIVDGACLALARLVPALALTGLAFVTIDVFVKTLFGFGISNSSGHQRFWYVALLGTSFLSFYVYFLGFERKSWVRNGEKAIYAVTFFLLLSSFVTLLYTSITAPEIVKSSAGTEGTRTPNILLIASDGLDADHLSVYGYERETTPFLEEIAPQTLFCENAFSNAGPTGASLASLLSGKLPTETRLIYPPDILRGRHAFQHLPMILGNLGYRSIHLSIRHFADAFDLNMRESFDSSNFRTLSRVQTSPLLNRLIGLNSTYFLEHVRDRLESRLMHTFGVAAMEDSFKEVQEEEGKFKRDHTLLEGLKEFIDESATPFFAHVHLLGTHGPRFRPKHRRFSKGRKQVENWTTDFYDDAILDFDVYLKEIVGQLREVGKMDNTLIIIHTDHAQRHRTDRRIPLMIWFPEGVNSGRISANTQLLDISPTILDFLGIKIPEWMGGRSLIGGSLAPDTPIYSVGRIHDRVVKHNNRLQLDSAVIKPPFYTLGYIRVIIGDSFFELDLKHQSLTTHRIPHHSYPSPVKVLPTREEAFRLLINHLNENGYQTSSLPGVRGGIVD